MWWRSRDWNCRPHDPRGFHGMGLEYAVGYRGACHLQHMSHTIEQGMTDQADTLTKPIMKVPPAMERRRWLSFSEYRRAASACLCLFVYDCIAVKDFADMIHVDRLGLFHRRFDQNRRKDLAFDAPDRICSALGG